jgi:DNA polymerase V
MYALVDCDNFFVSCERVFQPELKGHPVVVLSNNDGCVVARSNEAKALHIKMGTPYYQLRSMERTHGLVARSSNYALYADMSNRVMSLLAQAAPTLEIYSVDEGFLTLKGMTPEACQTLAEGLVKKIAQWVGLPVSIGIAPTRTLAKVASYYAKHYPRYNHVCQIDTDAKRIKALQLLPIDEVWGIGRRLSATLMGYRIQTAYDFTQRGIDWVRSKCTVTGARTWRELRGEDCIPRLTDDRKRSICTSRSFPALITEEQQLATYVSNYAGRCAAKLRRQHSVAALVTVFVDTNPFREDLPQYCSSLSRALTPPVSDTFELTRTALELLHALFRRGYRYHRAGVIVSEITPDSGIQTQLFDPLTPEQLQKRIHLSQLMDTLNSKMGDNTLTLGAQLLPIDPATGKATTFANSIKHDHRSRCYTTNLQDVIDVK